jgi:adenylosuccinate lyase
MIDRYTRPDMAELWSEQGQYQSWLDVELAACAAWSEVTGIIPAEDVARLYREARFDIGRIHEIEAETRHDVVAFTRSVSESLGEEKKWVHYGLTSSDVVDTALSVRLKKASELLLGALEALIDALARRAREHRFTICMGRTHGVHAEPTTFGLKLALAYDEMVRNRDRLIRAAEEVRVGKLSGAVGTFANIPPDVERVTLEKLDLVPAPISTQVIGRDRHAAYLSTLAVIGGSIERLALEIRHLQRTEVLEAEEAFGKGQKGSSAMPHKRNPIGSENLTGCARLLRGYALSALENIALWHERDISHSSVERVILPDATTILHYALHRMGTLVENLIVYPERMRENIDMSHGLVFSQQVLLKLIERGLSREEAYDTVQPLAMRAWQERRSFRQLVESSEDIRRHLGDSDIEQAFDSQHHLKHVDEIFRRVGLDG